MLALCAAFNAAGNKLSIAEQVQYRQHVPTLPTEEKGKMGGERREGEDEGWDKAGMG